MARKLPLLIFPQYKDIPPPAGRGFPPSPPTVPSRQHQISRLDQQLEQLNNEFANFSGYIHESAVGVEPEMTVVLELVSRIDKLERAVHALGLTWLGEWDIDLEPDEDFPVSGNQKTINRPLGSKKRSISCGIWVCVENRTGSDANPRIFTDIGRKKIADAGLYADLNSEK